MDFEKCYLQKKGGKKEGKIKDVDQGSGIYKSANGGWCHPYVGPYHTQGPLCTYIRGSAIHVKPIDIWENQSREHGEHILIKGPSRKRKFSKWLCDWESPEAKGEIRTLSIQQLYRCSFELCVLAVYLNYFLWSIIDKGSPTRKVSLFQKSWGLMALLIGCSNTFLAASQSFTRFT